MAGGWREFSMIFTTNEYCDDPVFAVSYSTAWGVRGLRVL